MQEQSQEQNLALKRNLQEQVKAQMATLTTRVPDYSELTDEERAIVDGYMEKIDVGVQETIDEFGKEETEEIYKELDVLIGTLKASDTSIEDKFQELMASIGENASQNKETFFEALKKSPIRALRVLRNKPKEIAEQERFRRQTVITNIGEIQTRLEEIRSRLRLNASKLEFIAQNSAKQYQNTQYQIIALRETRRRIEEERSQSEALVERTFSQIDRALQLVGVEKRIDRKVDNLMGVGVNAATKAIMSRLLAQHSEELASDYDQDLTTLLPELKGVVVTAEANDSLIHAADTHEQFVGKMNEMLRQESTRSREAIEKVQAISGGSAIDVETAKVLTGNVLEVVRELKGIQDNARPTNEAFTDILSDFRKQLSAELDMPKDTTSIDNESRVQATDYDER